MQSNNSQRSFNPAEAEDGFRSHRACHGSFDYQVSIQPKPKTGLEDRYKVYGVVQGFVSIQPKPKTGLEVLSRYVVAIDINCSFNPAEAEDGFRSICTTPTMFDMVVSIQPKPKTGLEVIDVSEMAKEAGSFNPAEAEDGFRRKHHQQPLELRPSFNPAEAEDGFRSFPLKFWKVMMPSFNPAEAEDGFRSQ